ncbi:MAG: hypothetical protein GX600_01620 [Dehalococcoidia bacterium]|nr:hypothetical protein [Dehalococcoidia bacterium]
MRIDIDDKEWRSFKLGIWWFVVAGLVAIGGAAFLVPPGITPRALAGFGCAGVGLYLLGVFVGQLWWATAPRPDSCRSRYMKYTASEPSNGRD